MKTILGKQVKITNSILFIVLDQRGKTMKDLNNLTLVDCVEMVVTANPEITRKELYDAIDADINFAVEVINCVTESFEDGKKQEANPKAVRRGK